MAFLIYDGTKHKIVSAEEGARLWRIRNGEVQETNRKWRNAAHRVTKFYLNPHTAPQSYVEQHRHLLHDNEPVVLYEQERWMPVIETRKDLI